MSYRVYVSASSDDMTAKVNEVIFKSGDLETMVLKEGDLEIETTHVGAWYIEIKPLLTSFIHDHSSNSSK